MSDIHRELREFAVGDNSYVKCADKAVRIQQVIITTNATRGLGSSESDPIRHILQVWSMDGELIAEKDFA